MRFGKIDDIKARVAAAIDASRKFLFSQQAPDEGYWCGELGADSTLVSDYILLHRLLGTEDPVRTEKCANEILTRQNDDGGFPIYNGGPSNISASVKAYFALKMAGYSPDHPAMVKARRTHSRDGRRDRSQHLHQDLSLLPWPVRVRRSTGDSARDRALPNWFWFNIYEISSWSRAILVPLSIAYAKKPFKKIPDEQRLTSSLSAAGRITFG